MKYHIFELRIKIEYMKIIEVKVFRIFELQMEGALRERPFE